jgi:hypothetical protein
MSKSSPQPQDSQVWAEKSRAAMVPAIWAEGRCENSIGTTTTISALRLPHQRPAAKTA